jgi:hypothetical protein
MAGVGRVGAPGGHRRWVGRGSRGSGRGLRRAHLGLHRVPVVREDESFEHLDMCVCRSVCGAGERECRSVVCAGRECCGARAESKRESLGRAWNEGVRKRVGDVVGIYCLFL